jgi:outer membrane lipoprotein-sorting protein
MQTSAARLVLAIIVAAVSVRSASAQTAEEILEKSITALGGRAAHAKLKSRSMSGTITIATPVGEVQGTIETLNAAPNKQRTLVKADLASFGAGLLEVDQRFDGSNGYVLDTLQGNRDITGNQLDNMRNSAFPHTFLVYKDLGIKVALAGKEKVGDRDAYIVVFEPPSGSTIRQFIDAETFMPVKFMLKSTVPQLGVDVEETVTMSDYRDVDGIKLPFRLQSTSSIQTFIVEIAKAAHNVPVDEKLFVKP